MRDLPIVWQRLVDKEGQTCPRCRETQSELNRAMAALESSLPLLGIRPSLEAKEIEIATFEEDPSESNRIWVAGKPIEEWLGAEASSSECCAACGDAACRTVELGEQTFEAIPGELVIRAALLAAAEIMATVAEGPTSDRRA